MSLGVKIVFRLHENMRTEGVWERDTEGVWEQDTEGVWEQDTEKKVCTLDGEQKERKHLKTRASYHDWSLILTGRDGRDTQHACRFNIMKKTEAKKQKTQKLHWNHK